MTCSTSYLHAISLETSLSNYAMPFTVETTTKPALVVSNCVTVCIRPAKRPGPDNDQCTMLWCRHLLAFSILCAICLQTNPFFEFWSFASIYISMFCF